MYWDSVNPLYLAFLLQQEEQLRKFVKEIEEWKTNEEAKRQEELERVRGETGEQVERVREQILQQIMKMRDETLEGSERIREETATQVERAQEETVRKMVERVQEEIELSVKKLQEDTVNTSKYVYINRPVIHIQYYILVTPEFCSEG